RHRVRRHCRDGATGVRRLVETCQAWAATAGRTALGLGAVRDDRVCGFLGNRGFRRGRRCGRAKWERLPGGLRAPDSRDPWRPGAARAAARLVDRRAGAPAVLLAPTARRALKPAVIRPAAPR